jgi:hypothetical protein|tara:strand:- start:1496 stop:1756 length:261 start_codon:yes stop_codon:yes gene_type:complete
MATKTKETGIVRLYKLRSVEMAIKKTIEINVVTVNTYVVEDLPINEAWDLEHNEETQAAFIENQDNYNVVDIETYIDTVNDITQGQ